MITPHKLKAVVPESPIQPTLKDPRFKSHEFATVEELFAKRFGWIPPTQRAHLKTRIQGEKSPVLVGRVGLGGVFIPEVDK